MVRLKQVVVLLGLCGINACEPQTSYAPVPLRSLIGSPENIDLADLSTALEQEKNFQRKRDYAWSITTRLLQQIPLQHDASFSLPLWMSFYDQQDFNSLMPLFAEELKKHPHAQAGQSALQRLSNRRDELSVWTPERIARWRSQFSDFESMAGAGGLSRAYYNRDLLKHVLDEFDTVRNCEDISAERDLEERRSLENFSLCFSKEFPKTSIAVKASWIRADQAKGIPAYRTDSQHFAKRLAVDSWDDADDYIDASKLPREKEPFAIKLQDGTRFYLSGLHMAFKQSRQWFWISLWWAYDAESDFGSDAPREQLVGAWKNYKLCTVNSHGEATFNAHDPEVSAALQEFSSKFPGRSWCSNPYLEKGHHNVSTNCIGCHQHAGSALSQEGILNKSDAEGIYRLDEVRKNFPADYIFGIVEAPDSIAARLRAALPPK